MRVDTTIGSNMAEIEFDNGNRVLVSYKTPVAAFVSGRGFVRTSHKWSATTTRHINKWLPVAASTVSQGEIEHVANGGTL